MKAIDAEFPDVLPRVAVSTFNWPVFMYQFWMQMFSPFSVMCHWLRGPKYRKQLINQVNIFFLHAFQANSTGRSIGTYLCPHLYFFSRTDRHHFELVRIQRTIYVSRTNGMYSARKLNPSIWPDWWFSDCLIFTTFLLVLWHCFCYADVHSTN